MKVEHSAPVLHLDPLHAVQVQDGQDDGHQEDDDTAHAHTDVEHLGGGGGGGHIYWWNKKKKLYW